MQGSSATTRRKPGAGRSLDDATRLAKALSHPLRGRILEKLNQRVASPNELAQELDAPLGNVSYHVRALLELGYVELVETAPRRGAVEHYYRAVEGMWAGDESTHLSFTSLELDESAWQELGELLREVVERAHELQAEAAGRREDGQVEGGDIPARLAIALYEGRPESRRRAT